MLQVQTGVDLGASAARGVRRIFSTRKTGFQFAQGALTQLEGANHNAPDLS